MMLSISFKSQNKSAIDFLHSKERSSTFKSFFVGSKLAHFIVLIGVTYLLASTVDWNQESMNYQLSIFSSECIKPLSKVNGCSCT